VPEFETAEVRRTPAAAPPTFAFGDAQLADFLARMRNAILATVRADGGPHATPAWYHWDGTVVRISSPGWTAKVSNVRRDPRGTVCVDDPLSGTYVTLFGRAEVVDGPTVREESWPILCKYLHEDEARVRWTRINAESDRVVIRINVSRAVWRNAVR